MNVPLTLDVVAFVGVFWLAVIVAIVLSAGESSRMGSPKALLEIEGQTFIERIISALRQTRAGKIVVVLGHHVAEIGERISHLPVKVVVNKDYKKGQLSSMQAAIRNLDAGEVDGILVHLVDHPFLSSNLVDKMIEQFYASGKKIIVPVHRGKRGHPVLFARSLFPELLDAPAEQGAKAVVRAHQNETLEIESAEMGVAIDIDTPKEYEEFVGRKGNVKG
jgi:molybdenum cofactor cytidylyltransferase